MDYFVKGNCHFIFLKEIKKKMKMTPNKYPIKMDQFKNKKIQFENHIRKKGIKYLSQSKSF